MGLSTGREKLGNMANTSRMTSYQRREQLIEIGRSLFAAKGFEAVSVEEIASTAKVSKPIVYEHFGGKEGLYAVVVDREMRALTDVLINALSTRRRIRAKSWNAPRLRCSPTWRRTPKLPRAHARFAENRPVQLVQFAAWRHCRTRRGHSHRRVQRQHLPAKSVPYYAQMLIGMTVYTCQYWADQRKLSKEQLAAHIVNLAWYGLSRMEAKPELRYESEKAAREAEKQAAREAKAIAKQEKQGKKAAKSQEKAVAAGDDATDGTTVTDGSQAVGKSQAADESNESDETNESQKPQSPHESQKQSTIDEN